LLAHPWSLIGRERVVCVAGCGAGFVAREDGENLTQSVHGCETHPARPTLSRKGES